MSFLEFPIKRDPFTLIAFLGLVALGIYSFNSIARSEDPYFPIPAFVISAILPGGDPVEMERLVSKPIEDRLADRDWMAGDSYTPADAYFFTVTNWSKPFAHDLSKFPRIAELRAKIAARPAVQKAMQAEGLAA